MNNTCLVLGGSLGMLVAVVHGYLGGTQVVAPIQGLNPPRKRVLHAIMFISAVYWFVGGAAVVSGTYYFDATTQALIALVVSAMYITGAIGNFWATRGRHIGWFLLMVAASLIILGHW